MTRRQTPANRPARFETRLFQSVRAQPTDSGLAIDGHAATFNDPYPIGSFEEQIAPGAFADSIAADDIRLLVNHEGLPLARTTAGTLELSEDVIGLRVRSRLDATDPDVLRLVPKMRRGDLDQMSFGFMVEKETWEERKHKPDLRTIEKAKLFDVSVVTFPANPSTSVALKRHREWRSSRSAARTADAEARDRELELAKARLALSEQPRRERRQRPRPRPYAADVLKGRPRWREAIHEAGHAVAALELGASVEWVRVGRGRSRIAYRIPEQGQAVITLAGRAAERVILGGVPEGGRNERDDARRGLFHTKFGNAYYPAANQCVTSTPGVHLQMDVITDALDDAEREAIRVIERNYMCVKAIASALMKRGRLTGSELRTIASEYLRLGNYEADRLREDFKRTYGRNTWLAHDLAEVIAA